MAERCAERPAAVKGAAFFGAAKRTLEGEDRSANIPREGMATDFLDLSQIEPLVVFASYLVERATAEKPRRPMRCSAEPPGGELSSSQAGRLFIMHWMYVSLWIRFLPRSPFLNDLAGLAIPLQSH